jgi:putative membrane protein
MRAPRRRRQLLLAATVAVTAAVALPLPGGGDDRLPLHMSRHLLLLELTPVLLLLAAGPTARRRRVPPLAAGVAATLIIVAWHVPPAFDAALREPALHVAEHASFLVAGLLLWAPVLSSSSGAIEALAFLFATRLVQTILGNVLLWAPRPLYDGSGTLHDQRLAAAIMLGEGTVATLAAGAWLVVRLLREEPPPVPAARVPRRDGAPAGW